MKKGLIAVIAVIVVVLMVLSWGIGTRNSLVSMAEEVRLEAAQVETQLQRRNDLIPNFVNTVKGYAAHEEEVYSEIADARAKLGGAIEDGDVEAMNEANSALDNALSRLLVVVEIILNLRQMRISLHFRMNLLAPRIELRLQEKITILQLLLITRKLKCFLEV